VVFPCLFTLLKRSRTILKHTLTRLAWTAVLLAGTVHGQTGTEVAAPPTEQMTARQRQWLNATLEQRQVLAERLGEEGAERFAAKQDYKPLLQNGDKALRQGLDQVYRAKDGSIVVIEAKGGTSAINRAYGFEQGTPEWAVESARRVAASPKASAAEKQAAREVLEAAKQGKLTVQVVRTKHVLGEPVAAVLEKSAKAGPEVAKRATDILKELDVAPKAAQSNTQAAKTTNAAGNATSKAAGNAGKAAGNAGKAAGNAAGTLSTIGMAAGAAGLAVDGGIRIHAALETERKYEKGEISVQERELAHAKNAAGAAGGACGGIAGSNLGATIGGTIGTCVFPGPGTVVGAAVGGIAGGVAGYFGGEAAAEEAASWVVKMVHKSGRSISATAK